MEEGTTGYEEIVPRGFHLGSDKKPVKTDIAIYSEGMVIQTRLNVESGESLVGRTIQEINLDKKQVKIAGISYSLAELCVPDAEISICPENNELIINYQKEK